jgi:hypothetical protein
MNIAQLIDYLKTYDPIMRNVRLWMKVDATPGRYADFPASLDERIVAQYKKRGSSASTHTSARRSTRWRAARTRWW